MRALISHSQLVVAVLALAPCWAEAQPTTPSDEATLEYVPPPGPKIVVRGCPPGPSFEVGSLVYIGCGSTVFVMERRDAGTVAERGRQRVRGTAASFFDRDGTVWVEVRTEAGETSAAPVELEPSHARVPRPAPDPRYAPPPLHAPYAQPPHLSLPQDPDQWSKRAVARRAPGTSIHAGVAPFLGDGEYGVLARGGVSYRADVPLTIHAHLDPFAYGSNTSADISTYALRVDATLDTDFIEIGFGTGSQRYRERERGGWGDPVVLRNTHAPSLGFRARFGALDGVHLDTRIRWAFVDGVTRFSDVFLEFLIPTWKNGWIQATGGGGERLGLWLFNVGVRTSALGKIEMENLFLSFAIGWAGMDKVVAEYERERAQGFQAALALEYRIASKKSREQAAR